MGRIVCCCSLLVTAVAVARVDARQAAAPSLLSEAQQAAFRTIQADAAKTAEPIAVRLASVVQRIYMNNLADAPDAALRASLDDEMKDLVWRLLLTKGESMWAAVRLLTPEQRQIIRDAVTKPQPGADLPDLMDLITRAFHVADKKPQ